MFKIIILLAAGYILYKVVKNGIYLAFTKEQKSPELRQATELEKCDQCGAFVSKDGAIHKKGKTFCSESCQKHFESSS